MVAPRAGAPAAPTAVVSSHLLIGARAALLQRSAPGGLLGSGRSVAARAVREPGDALAHGGIVEHAHPVLVLDLQGVVEPEPPLCVTRRPVFAQTALGECGELGGEGHGGGAR